MSAGNQLQTEMQAIIAPNENEGDQAEIVAFDNNTQRGSNGKMPLAVQLLLWLLVIYSVAMSTYSVILMQNTNSERCSCSPSSVEQALQSTTAPTITMDPTNNPTNNPTNAPSNVPIAIPTINPSFGPTAIPTMNPSNVPTINPLRDASLGPSFEPSSFPSIPPTVSPSSAPTISHASIVQIQSVISHTKVTISDVSVWIEPSSDYRVSITPKYADSMFLITYNFGWNGYDIDANTIVLWSAARSIGSGLFSRETITSSGTVHSSRHRISGMATRRNNGQDANDMNFCNWMTIDYPNTTQDVTYTLYMFQESVGAGSLTIGDSFVDTDVYGWTTPVSIVVMEIQNSN